MKLAYPNDSMSGWSALRAATVAAEIGGISPVRSWFCAAERALSTASRIPLPVWNITSLRGNIIFGSCLDEMSLVYDPVPYPPSSAPPRSRSCEWVALLRRWTERRETVRAFAKFSHRTAITICWPYRIATNIMISDRHRLIFGVGPLELSQRLSTTYHKLDQCRVWVPRTIARTRKLMF